LAVEEPKKRYSLKRDMELKEKRN